MDCREVEPLVTAWIDGEATPADRARVDEHLQACPPCRGRVAAESAAREALRAQAPELVRGCAPAGLRARCEAAARRPSGGTSWLTRALPLGAAAAVILTVGGLVLMLTSRSATVMAAQLTLDHLKCFESLDPKAAAASPSDLEARLVDRLGWRADVPPGSEREGLRLLTARRCLYADGRIAHVLYRHQGRPVSLFQLPDTRAAKVVDVMGHETVVWPQNGRSYVLVARESRAELEHLAAYVRNTVK